MSYVCRRYCLSMYRYIYAMIIVIKPDNNWYAVICYMHKKTRYSHIYPSTYNVRVHMLLPKRVGRCGHKLGRGPNMGRFRPSCVRLVYFLREST